MKYSDGDRKETGKNGKNGINGQKESKEQRAYKRKKRQRRRVVTLAVLAAIALGLFAFIKMWAKPPETSEPPDEVIPSDPGGASVRKDGYYTFVVCGTDDGNGNTDTILVGSFDTVNDKVNVISVPRDTMINVPWSIKKINSAYGAGGVDRLSEELAGIIGFTPDFYVIVDLDAFVKIVDTIGGVDFDVPQDMDYDDPYQDLHIHLKEGPQTLDGEEAIQLVRFRHGYVDGDMGRIAVQQDFMKALAAQCLKIGNLTKVTEFANIFSEYVKTDLSVGNMVWLGTQLLEVDTDDIGFHTLPGNQDAKQNGLSYFTIYIDDTLAMVNQYINPYNEDITEDDVDILTQVNGSLYATSGTVEGGVNSFYNASHSSGSSSSGSGSSSATASGNGSEPESTPGTTDGSMTDEPVTTEPSGETGEPETTGENTATGEPGDSPETT